MKNTIEISKSAAAFVVLLAMGIVGYTGYLYSKVTTEVNKPTVLGTVTTAPQQPAKVTVTIDQVKSLFNDKNIVLGNKDSKLLFVEFSDPSCPFCHVAAGKNGALNKQMGAQFVLKADGGTYVAPVPEMKKLVDEGKAGMVWLYANGHGNGEMGTKALYCANEQGKFWQVHDLLMSSAGYTLMNTTMKNDKTKSGVLADFLKSAVKPSEMKACLDSGKYDDRLTSDMTIAQQFGFGGTPDFFVNTTNFEGAYGFTEMQSTVDAVLK
jgi:protein-disulfide isomerase